MVLNTSLKHADEGSNTQEVVDVVLEKMKLLGDIEPEIIRISDKNIPVGVGYKESKDDEWPAIVEKIREAQIVIFATPVWWGQRSSLMQRVIERMDAFDEDVIQGGRKALLNKVAGVVVTGSEDGAQQVIASILEVLMFMNFTLPPKCAAYWVGEVGLDPQTDAERRRKSKAVPHMAESMAQGLMHYAKILRDNPMSED